MTVERALATSRDRQVLPPTGRRIRLMIVDDSMVARAVLSRIVESDEAFEIAAVAGTAEDAIDALQAVRVDIILLDLDMPGAGGLKSIPRILQAAAGAHVMVVSSVAEAGAEETIAALSLGAADALPKPGTGRFNGRFSEVLLGRLRSLGYAETYATPAKASASPVLRSPLRAMSSEPPRLLAIGASTGGIPALSSFFGALHGPVAPPILVTQHLPAPFMSVFARQLAIASGRETVVAEDGAPLVPGRIVIAPGDAHLRLERRSDRIVVRLDRSRSESGCMPSLDPMFESVAELFGTGAVGVVLTGMGRDGLAGARRIIARGGSVMAQDEATCAVWGMPRAVLEAGLACAVLPPEQIARRLAARLGDSACK